MKRVEVTCTVCGKTNLVSKQSFCAAKKNPKGYRHLHCAKEKITWSPKTELKLILNAWKQRGFPVDQNWLDNKNLFVDWAFSEFKKLGVDYTGRGVVRFSKIDKSKPFSETNTKVTKY